MVFGYTEHMGKLPGDEQYLITDQDNGIMHKVDLKGVPDMGGEEYHIVDELDKGYMVYIKSVDAFDATIDFSQPNSLFFIHQQFVINHKQK